MEHRVLLIALVLWPVATRPALSQRMSLGACPDVRPVRDFDLNRFSGEWMEVERSFYLVESPITCTKVNFTGNGNETLNVDITYKTPWRRTISSASYDADMYYEPGTINMILKTNLPFFVARLTPGSGKYVVLDTDYEQSALIYSCINWRFVHADFVWVLGRKMEISPEMRVKMYSILDKYNINRDRLFISSRNNC